jgi:hypothetical protein
MVDQYRIHFDGIRQATVFAYLWLVTCVLVPRRATHAPIGTKHAQHRVVGGFIMMWCWERRYR